MKTVIRLFIALIGAVIATSLLASMSSSQFVVAGLQEVGTVIPIRDRLSMTLSDFAILKALCPIVAVCFLLGFIVAGLANRYIGGNRTTWYIAAGFCAFIATLLILSAVFQLAPVAGARSNLGMFFMGLAGAVGGWAFANLSRIKGQ